MSCHCDPSKYALNVKLHFFFFCEVLHLVKFWGVMSLRGPFLKGPCQFWISSAINQFCWVSCYKWELVFSIA